MRGQPAEGTFRKLSLSPRRGTPVSEDSRRWNGALWKGPPVERFTGGTEMDRSGNGLNWRSQAPKQPMCRCRIGSQGSQAREP